MNCYFLASVKNCTLESCQPQTIDKSSLNICQYPKHSCDNNTVCVPVNLLCNGINDCLDGSDEGKQCGKLVKNIFVFS